MAAIFYASTQADVAMPSGLTDKPLHMFVYAGLSVLMVRALAGGLGAGVTAVTVVAAVAMTVAYGVTDEIHQMFVPGRYADVRDVVADAIGGAAGAALCWVWGIISRARTGIERRPPHGL